MVHSICLIMMVGIGPLIIESHQVLLCYYLLGGVPPEKSILLFNLPKYLTMDSS